jgi:cytidylate kinase
MIITIDGPSASGKSTIARSVARELSYFYIASGMIYRGLAYMLINKHGYTPDTIGTAKEHDVAYCLSFEQFAYDYDQQTGEHIIVGGTDITGLLKSPIIDSAASVLGTNAMARGHILQAIRRIADSHDIVIDGRDCGSAMFPYAQHKWFLTASLPVRAQRWQSMQQQLGKKISLEQAKNIIAVRDERDTTREIAPLVVPVGACIIDSSDMSPEQVIHTIVSGVKKSSA